MNVSVNRHGSSKTKGNLEKEIALMELEDNAQQEDAIAYECKDEKNINKKKLVGEIKLR